MADSSDPAPAGPDVNASDRVPDRDHADGGAAVLVWLTSDEASMAARRCLTRSAFPTGNDLIDDVIGEASLAVARQRARGMDRVENPAAYGSTVIRNIVHHLVRRDSERLDDVDEPVAHDVPDDDTADDVRVLIGGSGADEVSPWMTSASLTYLTLLMFPAAVPDHVPRPIAGSRPDQARAWPALWFAGLHDLFPDPCPEKIRRRRARRIADLLDHLEGVFAAYRLQLEREDG